MTQPPSQPGQSPQPGQGPQPGYTQPWYDPRSGSGTQPGYGAQPGTQPGYSPPWYEAQTGHITETGNGLPGYPASPQQPYGQPPYGSPYQYPGGYPQLYGKDPRLAEWWQRLVARIIDGLVLAVLTCWIWIPAYVRFLDQITSSLNSQINNPAAQQTALTNATHQLFVTILLLVAATAGISFVYDWLQHGLWGQTLGKRAMGTVVVTADTWSKIGAGAAAGRAAVYALPSGIPYAGGLFGLVNELWLLGDSRRQCLHDKAAHTVVAKKAVLAALAAQGQAGYPGAGMQYPGYPGYQGGPPR